MLSQMWFFFFLWFDISVIQECTQLVLITWPRLLPIPGPPRTGRRPPRMGSRRHQHLQVGSSLTFPPSLFPFSLSVRLRQCTRHIPSVSSPAESLWITPPKKKGRVPMSHRLHIKTTEDKQSLPPSTPSIQVLFSHTSQTSVGNCLTCAGFCPLSKCHGEFE